VNETVAHPGSVPGPIDAGTIQLRRIGFGLVACIRIAAAFVIGGIGTVAGFVFGAEQLPKSAPWFLFAAAAAVLFVGTCTPVVLATGRSGTVTIDDDGFVVHSPGLFQHDLVIPWAKVERLGNGPFGEGYVLDGSLRRGAVVIHLAQPVTVPMHTWWRVLQPVLATRSNEFWPPPPGTPTQLLAINCDTSDQANQLRETISKRRH